MTEKQKYTPPQSKEPVQKELNPPINSSDELSQRIRAAKWMEVAVAEMPKDLAS